MRSDEDTDPMANVDVGETVTVRESKTLHSINYTPDVYFGRDRFGDIDIADVELVETDDMSVGPDIRITWEGEMTKQLPERWDYHADPITEEEIRTHRRKVWLRRVGKALGVLVPLGLVMGISTLVMNQLAGELTINGETATFPTAGDMAPVLLMILLIASIIVWGLDGKLPRRI